MSWQTFFTYAPFVFWLLTGILFVRRLDLRLRHQARWMMVLLLCFSKFLVFRELGKSAFSPDLPEVLIWLWDWAYSGAVLLMGLSVVFFFRFRGKAWLLPLAAWGLSAWGLWNGLRIPDVKEVELAFDDLPASLDGYRIVQLSDIHCSSAARRWRTQAIVDKANALDADLICLTGDNVDGFVSRQAESLEPIGELRAKDGVVACTGNHAYYFRYLEWLTQFYSRMKNIRFLTNECVFPRTGLAVAGVPDATGARKRIDAPPDVRTAFAAATNGEFRILLQHQPKKAAENVREAGVNLQLSGHTHGGIAPGMRQIVAVKNDSFVRGAYRIGKSVLYVNSGCGQWAGFPIRFLTPSEVTVIVLRRNRTLPFGNLPARKW